MTETVKSQNGWPVVGRDRIRTVTVPGSAVRLPVLDDPDVRDILTAVACWVDRTVEDIDTRKVVGFEVPDDWGYAFRKVRLSKTVMSNHASGTAVDLNATRHPRFKRGTWTVAQVARVGILLDKLNGTVRWGEHYTPGRVDGMHFEINTTDRAALKVAASVARAAVRDLLDPPRPPATIKRVLRYRPLRPMVGPDVRAVQRLVGVPVTGTYDRLTRARVITWQHVHPAAGPADGVWGPKSTRAAGWTWAG